MKRSDALILIQNQMAIKCGAMQFPCVVSDLCDAILTKLEEAGMTPPSYVMDPECIGSQIEDQWEPE